MEEGEGKGAEGLWGATIPRRREKTVYYTFKLGTMKRTSNDK